VLLAKVYKRKDETIDQLIDRFNAQVQKEKILKQTKRRRYFMTKKEIRKVKRGIRTQMN